MIRSNDTTIGDIAAVLWPLAGLLLVSALAGYVPAGDPARLVLALVGLLVFPGYVVSLAVFPLRRPAAEDEPAIAFIDGDWTLPSLTPAMRWAVAVGFSLTLAPLYGFIIALGSLPYEFTPIVTVVVALTAVLTALALVRRLRLPDTAKGLGAPIPRPDRFLGTVTSRASGFSATNLAVVAVVVLAAGALTMAVVAPGDGNTYTTVALGTENESGEFVTAGYPHDLAPGESADLAFRLENSEKRALDYTVVVQTQRVNEGGEVVESRQLDQFSNTVGHDESWTHPHQITPTMEGDRVRVAYLVYVGNVPDSPTIDNSYRSLTLWIREPMPGETEAAAQTTAPTTETEAAAQTTTPTTETETATQTTAPTTETPTVTATQQTGR